MSPLRVPNFSPTGARIHVLWLILQSLQKEEEKKTKKKKSLTLAARISEMAEVIFFTFGMQTILPRGHACSKFGFNRVRDQRATTV